VEPKSWQQWGKKTLILFFERCISIFLGVKFCQNVKKKKGNILSVFPVFSLKYRQISIENFATY
jgi:hypothetical protein